MANSRAGAKVLSLSAALGLTMTCSTILTTLGALPAHAGDVTKAVQKYNAKDYQGALNEFKIVYAKDPKDSLCRYYMALCNQCLARIDEAKKDYKWVVDNGPKNLAAQAQAGLSQLEKVNVRTGGADSTPASAPGPTTTASAAATTKGGPDLIDRSKDAATTAASGKDAKGKDASGKGATGKDASGKSTAAGATKADSATKAAPAAAASSGAVDKVLNFYSDASRQSQLMEGPWGEVKEKYPKINFVKVNAGDPLCEKYGVTEFPTVIVLDKSGKALATQAGNQSADSMASTIDQCNQKK
jgi:tetratricopeptide (TPR) repeat protein